MKKPSNKAGGAGAHRDRAARIFPAAETRLLEIWDYTLERWGERQADAYIRKLVGAIHDLGRQRQRWRRVADRDVKVFGLSGTNITTFSFASWRAGQWEWLRFFTRAWTFLPA